MYILKCCCEKGKNHLFVYDCYCTDYRDIHKREKLENDIKATQRNNQIGKNIMRKSQTVIIKVLHA